MILYLFIALPVLLATFVYLVSFRFVKIMAMFIQAGVFIASVCVFLSVKEDGPITAVLGRWPVVAGIALRADSLSSVFLILITFLFLVCFIFGFVEDYVNNRFIFMFAVLQSLLIAIFLSSDLFNIFLAIEVSTVLVAILIMFKKDSRSIYDGLIYLLTNVVGMAFFLLGIAYIYKMFGVLDIRMLSEMIQDNPGTREGLYMPFALLMTGAGMKCAVIPLFSWLPKAHGTPSAPSIVSAVLSGLYVKGGIYLFIRISGMFSPTLEADEYFLIIGLLTALGGVILAFLQTDIKLILAYHTISQLGLIMTGLTMGSECSYWGAVQHVINHAIFKSALFLAAGLIIKEYGTRSIYGIRGVFKRMPVVSIGMLMAMLGITGAPLFNGSISKYYITGGATGTIVQLMLMAVNFGTILSFVKYSTIFFGNSGGKKTQIGLVRRITVLLMGVMCLLGGIQSIFFSRLFFDVDLSIEYASYAEKSVICFGSILVAYLLYKFVLGKSNLLKRGYSLELTMNGVSLSILLYFVITLVVVRILNQGTMG